MLPGSSSQIIKKHWIIITFSSAIRSALGARLYIELKTGDDIPDTVEKQAQWWSDYYHDGGEKDTFVTKVNEYENGKLTMLMNSAISTSFCFLFTCRYIITQ